MFSITGRRWESHPLKGGIRLRRNCTRCAETTKCIMVIPKKHSTVLNATGVEKAC
jgi:hypothetical protein